MALQRKNQKMSRAVMSTIEPLERRQLMTTITSPDSNGNDTVMEFRGANSTTIRVVLHGNTSAEFIGLEVNPGDEMNGVPVGRRALVNLRPADAPLVAPDVGADIFKIYITQADADSFISIAEVAAPQMGGGGNARPMMPFSGARQLRVVNIDDEGDPFINPSFGSIGGIVIGAVDIANSPQNGPDGAGTPILTAPADPGTVPGLPNDAFEDIENDQTGLRAGIQSAPNVTIGKILIGGVVMGDVNLGGSIDTFYAGALLTGDARGLNRFANPDDINPNSADDLSVADNFFVDGDIRSLITGGSIGTDTLADADPLQNRHYNTGVQIAATGRIGNILTTESFYGGARAEATRPDTELRTNVRETEFRAATFTGGATLFQRGEVGDRSALDSVRNDTFDQPQLVSTYFDSSLNENDVIQIDGRLVPALNVLDNNDYYGLPLLAGQTISVDFDGLTDGGQAFFQAGVFDPDGRLIATDNEPIVGNQVALSTLDPNAPFRFTADRPGVYRIAVGTNGDFEFDGDTTQRPGITYSRSVGSYTITIRGAADLNFGSVDARSSLITDAADSDSLSVLDGDLGAILAGDVIAQDGPIDLSTRRFFANRGNLRAMVASSIGFNDVGLAGAPHLHFRKGSVGLVRTTGTEDSDVLYLNPTDANPTTGNIDRVQAVGVDYQWVDSATQAIGNFIAKRSIGVIRAASLAHLINGLAVRPSFYVANSDGVGSDGLIGLIDTPGDFGNGTTGGIAIDTGSDGNVRYINVGGDSFRDRFFGNSAAPEQTSVGSSGITLTDDSGIDFTLEPKAFGGTSGGFGQQPNPNGSNSGNLTYTALPIRSAGGARSGFVLVKLASSTGLRVTSGSRSGNASVDIAGIQINGTTNASQTIRAEFVGSGDVNVLGVTGTAFTTISNATPGELVNVEASSIGSLIGNTLGLTPKINGIALLGFSTRRDDAFPFTDQRVLINVTGNVTTINSRQGMGNINVEGNVTTIKANSNDSGVSGVFEGINEPIRIGGTLTTLNIGEGVLPSGSGQAARSGVFVVGTISNVVNQGLQSDIRGDVIASGGIGTITLTDGAIIGADVGALGDFESATNNNEPRLFTGAVDSINITGVGGIIGSEINGSPVSNIKVNGGFGIVSSTISSSGSSSVGTINVDGYGVRSSRIDGGGSVSSVVANGTGKRLDTNSYTASVRQSTTQAFDPLFGTVPNAKTDLHAFLGTSNASPKKKGVSNQGVIADSQIVAATNLGSLRAWQIQARDPFIRNPGGVNDGTPIPFSSNQFPMRVSFGQAIGAISTANDIVGLSVNSAGLGNVTVRGSIERASFGVSGRVDNFEMTGTFKGTSALVVSGPDGALVRMRTGGSLFGQVNVTLGVGEVSVDGDFGSPSFLAARNIDLVDIAGNVLTGARIRSKRTIVNLNIDGDVQAGSTIQAKIISNQDINGNVFGNIVVGS